MWCLFSRVAFVPRVRWLDTAYSYTQGAHSLLTVLDKRENVWLSEPTVCLGRWWCCVCMRLGGRGPRPEVFLQAQSGEKPISKTLLWGGQRDHLPAEPRWLHMPAGCLCPWPHWSEVSLAARCPLARRRGSWHHGGLYSSDMLMECGGAQGQVVY